MNETILEDVKNSLGINPDNLGFNLELLVYINSSKSFLVQLGVAELDIDISQSTTWPSFPSEIVESLSKNYIITRTKQTFDPVASETIAKAIVSYITELEGRIAHEISEILDLT